MALTNPRVGADLSMPIERADDPAAQPKEVRLRDLRAGLDGAMIVGRVVTASRREVTLRGDGGRRPVLSGLLSDGSATVRYTWWDPPREEIEPGLILRAVNVQVREFRGKAELSFSSRTRVALASESELPVPSPDDFPMRPVHALTPNDEAFRVEVRVLKVAPKTVRVGEEEKRLFEGQIADNSGVMAFTAWCDFHLVEGEAVDVIGAYVRAFRGRSQLVLDERATVRRSSRSGLPSHDQLSAPVQQKIVHIESSGGGENLRTEGIVIGLMPPSGLVHQCPNCRRSVVKGVCRLHGAVAGTPDLRARLVVDDGTGAMTLQLGRSDTERLMGRTLADCLDDLKVQPDASRVEERLFEATFGRRIGTTGRATKDDFGVTFFPEEVHLLAPDVDRALASLRLRLGGGIP